MAGPVFLQGENVELRTVEEEDLEFLRNTVNHPEVRSGLGYVTPHNMEEEREWFQENEEQMVLAVCREGKIVGNIVLKEERRDESGEIGIMINPEFQGEGYGSEAVQLLMQHAFDQLNVHKLKARALETNTASQSIWKKFGFQREGVHREEFYCDGEYRDAYWYGLLRREYKD